MADQRQTPQPISLGVLGFSILIDGKELDSSYLMMNMEIITEVNRIPKAKLQYLDGSPSKQTFTSSDREELVPGKKIEIQLGSPSAQEIVFQGIIISQQIKIRDRASYLIIECRDEVFKMAIDKVSGYHTDLKDSEVMETLIDQFGFQRKVEATSIKHPEMVQFESTHWDFIITRCEANGFFCNVDKGKITIGKPDFTQSPVVTASYGHTILELDAELDARHQVQSTTAITWNPADQKIRSTPAEEPSLNEVGNLDFNTLQQAIGKRDENIWHSGSLTEPQQQLWADTKLMRQRMAKTCGRVKIEGLSTIKPGMVMEIAKLAERFQGNLWVSGVRHEVNRGSWTTDIQFGLSPEWHFQQFDLQPPKASGLLPPISGLHIAVVTKIESDPEGEDRIQVRMPIINPQAEGIWARIATLDAGKDRGSFFRPEIEDEVIVGFVNDDPRYAVVLGMLHSSAKPAPHQPKDTNHLKGLVTRSGMRLWFNDEKKITTIDTPAGNKLILTEDDESILIQDQHQNQIVMNGEGILIESKSDLTLKAANDILMEGLNITLKAKSEFTAEGSSGATLKANASTTVEGSISTIIKGGQVLINS